MLVPVTGLYAALLAVLCVILSGAVGRIRGQSKLRLGELGGDAVIVANRRHMNFVENVPLALLLIGLVELNGAPKGWVHGLGAVLLVCRIAHPFGLAADSALLPARVIGAAGTYLVMLAAGVTLLWQFVK